MSFVPPETVRLPLINCLLAHAQQTSLYNTHNASITAESAERLKDLKEEHQKRMQYAKENHDTLERYMKEEHDAKMRILEVIHGDRELEKQKGAGKRDKMEIDETKQKFEVRKQDDEMEEKPEPCRKRKTVNASQSQYAVKKRG